MTLFPRAVRPNVASVDLTDFDLAPAIGAARNVAGRLTGVAKDATYTAIGFGILGLQKAHTRRNQISRATQR